MSLTPWELVKCPKIITKASPNPFREDEVNLVKKTKRSLWRAFARSVMAIRKKVMKKSIVVQETRKP